MSDQSNTQAPMNERDQLKERARKLEAWRASGLAYPEGRLPSDDAASLLAAHDAKTAEALEKEGVSVRICGRMMMQRLMGKASFAHLQDASGRMQVYVRRDDVGESVYADFKQWDLGDIVEASGVLFRTKTGALSVHAHEIRLLTKALRPMPDKFHGLHDQEMRYRQRYLDLIANEGSKDRFVKRSKIIQSLRHVLLDEGFLEVETPMMHPIPGGAVAKPFVTHHHALSMDLYLRIAPELYLKRLLVGGFDRVFEINRNFRNEGISTKHNPEFTEVEFYQAYTDYHALMDLTERMFLRIAKESLGSNSFSYQGSAIDFSKKFKRITVLEALTEHDARMRSDLLYDAKHLLAWLHEAGVKDVDDAPVGVQQMTLFETLVEDHLMQPTFITGYPVEVSPLARRSDKDPRVTDRFELYIGGMEIANGFSELNDPEDQAARFKAQAEERASGDDEAMFYDEDFVHALEYGMPPAAGEGIGIDRLVMLLLDAPSIRDVLLFPHMKAKPDQPSASD